MPEIDFQTQINCLNDQVTQVRDRQGNLVGCIPKLPEHDSVPYITAGDGQNFNIGVFAVMAVIVDPGQDPRSLNGFVANPSYVKPREERNLLAEAIKEGVEIAHPGYDPDLGKEL